MALGSPGPSAQSFKDAFVQKNPGLLDSQFQTIQNGGLKLKTDNAGMIVEIPTDSTQYARLQSSKLFMAPLKGQGVTAFLMAAEGGDGIEYPQLSWDVDNLISIFGYYDQVGNLVRIRFRASDATLGSNAGFEWESTSGLLQFSGLLGLGAQVGQPTGSAGPGTGTIQERQMVTAAHRHAFSGRFLGNSHTLPLGQGAGLPFNFARVKINNAWTLRRIWVYAQVGPTGGTETYGIVNAAGALQGTAVVLPAGAGATQAESALQVTNLTGGTLYYVAQTAIGAGWAAGSTNTEVGFEYTMNI